MNNEISEDGDFVELVNLIANERRIPRVFRQRPDYFRRLRDFEFVERFRLSKPTVWNVPIHDLIQRERSIIKQTGNSILICTYLRNFFSIKTRFHNYSFYLSRVTNRQTKVKGPLTAVTTTGNYFRYAIRPTHLTVTGPTHSRAAFRCVQLNKVNITYFIS